MGGYVWLDLIGSRAGIKFATPTLVVPTSNFFIKSRKVYFQRKCKDNKVWIRLWPQVNYSQNKTLFLVNYEGFWIDWVYAHTGHTIWESTMNDPIITLQFQNISATRKEELFWKCFNIVFLLISFISELHLNVLKLYFVTNCIKN